jgi:hypothetical protein
VAAAAAATTATTMMMMMMTPKPLSVVLSLTYHSNSILSIILKRKTIKLLFKWL